MTSIIPPAQDASFDEKVAFYRGLSKISPDVVSGHELKAMALAWLKANGVSPHNSPKPYSNRRGKG